MKASTSSDTKTKCTNVNIPVSNIWKELYVKTTSIQSLTKELSSLKNQVEERRKRNEGQCNLLKEKECVHDKLSLECIGLRTTIDMHEDEIQQYLKSIQVIDEKIKLEEGHLNEKLDELLNLRAEYTSAVSAVLDSSSNVMDVMVHEGNTSTQSIIRSYQTAMILELPAAEEKLSQVGKVLPIKKWNSSAELAQSIANSRDIVTRLKAKCNDLIRRCEVNTNLHEHLLAKVKELDADIVNERAKYETKEKLKQKKCHSPFKRIGDEAQPLVRSQVSTPLKFTQELKSQNTRSYHSSSPQQCTGSETPIRDVPIGRIHQHLTASIKTDGYAPPLKNRMRSFPIDDVANIESEVVANKKKFIPKRPKFSNLKNILSPNV